MYIKQFKYTKTSSFIITSSLKFLQNLLSTKGQCRTGDSKLVTKSLRQPSQLALCFLDRFKLTLSMYLCLFISSLLIAIIRSVKHSHILT